jgi:capsular polysaccharide biosynthesis protein
MLGVSPKRIVFANTPTSYKFAFFTTNLSHRTISAYPAVVLRLKDRLHEAAEGQGIPSDRIWVERGKEAKGRNVINKEEIYSCINKFGFVPVDYGMHTFRDQMQIDKKTDIMAGIHGSAFVHCGFMTPRREIIEIFSPFHIHPSVLELCKVLEHNYNQIVTTHTEVVPYRFEQDAMIDIDHLELILSSLQRRRGQFQ